VIDFLRGSGPGADLVESSLRSGVLRFSAVTAFELRLGADFLRRRRLVEAMLARRTLRSTALPRSSRGRSTPVSNALATASACRMR